MSQRTLIRAVNLGAGYGRGTEVLSSIDFTLHEGEKLAIVGTNGCGKTTLLRVLSGTLPYSGSLEITVQDPASAKAGQTVQRKTLSPRQAARETGFLTQLSAAYFSFSVAETVMLGRYAHQKPGFPGHPAASDRLAVEEALVACDIADIRDEPLSHLSGGQLQRVFLARTFAQNPATILLDEPTNHLDLHFQLDLIGQLNRWTASGTHAAIGVFHDLSLALRFADTALLLENGRITDYGPAGDVLRGEAINRAYRMDVVSSVRELLQNW